MDDILLPLHDFSRGNIQRLQFAYLPGWQSLGPYDQTGWIPNRRIDSHSCHHTDSVQILQISTFPTLPYSHTSIAVCIDFRRKYQRRKPMD